MDYLILTEKNSAFKKYEEALGGRSGKYEGKSYQLVHARGHLLELEEPAKQVSPALKEQYQSWDPENMPWNVSDLRWRKATIDSSAKQLLNTIGSLSKGAKAIVIATDNDPSGEGELLKSLMRLVGKGKSSEFTRSMSRRRKSRRQWQNRRT